MKNMVNLADLSISDLANFIQDIGQEKYRAKQIFKWIHKGIIDIDDMTNLSKYLREELKKSAYICRVKIVERLQSKIDGTVKYLLELQDGNVVESVLMKYSYGYSICISSQVGCRMGCKFCASTGVGFVRDLTPGEMLQEILVISKDLGERIGHVVMMGIGEPFDNYDNVIKFLEIVNDKDGLNVGYRHITISTCGIVPKILEFAKKNIQVTLSISLHGANDIVRENMMPINRKYRISMLMDACFEYTKTTNRRITFEYALVDGVNDTKKDALELVKLIKGMLCHVNLIPINEVDSFYYKRSKRNSIEEFRKVLASEGINATVRRELGSDIKAACGQLRRSKL